MLSIFRTKARYDLVEDGDYEGELKLPGPPDSSSSYVTVKGSLCSVLVLAFLFLSSIVSTWILFLGFTLQRQHTATTSAPVVTLSPNLNGSPWVCQQPTVRREWRSLADPEKLEYVNAVKCLATKPSKLRNSGTLYDDFPWIHTNLSSKTHVSAPFFPWHRYYIHLYEKALKEECSFGGSIPYWDWSLDWSNFHAAPVWNVTSGFGGDGSGSDSVGDGRCVISGPFADIEVMFYDGDVQPHCLSRGFPEDDELMRLGELIQPKVIHDLMDEDEYETFASELERRAHKFMSHTVRGDFSRFTGPNDPVFFLHHTNLDRIWSQWQQISPQTRSNMYSGRANKDSMVAAEMTDTLDMGGLSRNLQVSDVMDTTGSQFCYRY